MTCLSRKLPKSTSRIMTEIGNTLCSFWMNKSVTKNVKQLPNIRLQCLKIQFKLEHNCYFINEFNQYLHYTETETNSTIKHC